jgi:hypothetical protein
LASVFGPAKPGEFLVVMGMLERVISLLTRHDCTEEMGEPYKVLGFIAIGPDAVDDRPPGF